MESQITTSKQERAALAACYRLLLQKAREKRQQVAVEDTAVSQDESNTNLVTTKEHKNVTS